MNGVTQFVIKTLLRFCLKPFFGPPFPLAWRRRWIELGAKANRPLKSVRLEPLRLNDVPVERISDRTRDASIRQGGKLVVYCHGGAYISGSIATHRNLLARLAKASGAVVYAVDYALAPEAPFPQAIDQMCAVFDALLAAGASASNIVFAGDSAGGNLALVTCLALQRRGGALPRALVLLSPWVDLREQQSSPEHTDLDRRDVMVRWSMLREAIRAYIPHHSPDDPLVSPVLAESIKVPDILLQAGTEEILLPQIRHFAEQFHKQLRFELYPGMWHVFQLHARMLATSDQALQSIAEFISSLSDSD